MKIHPTAKLFPLLEGAEFDKFAETIRDVGHLIHPIVMLDDVLIDGRNRLKACKTLGIEPSFVQLNRKEYPDELSIIRYIIGANIGRRMLNAGQLAMLAIDMSPQYKAAAKAQQEAGLAKGRELGVKSRQSGKADSGAINSATVDRSGRVNYQLEKDLKVSHSTIAQARKVEESSPELAAKVRAGSVKLGTAFKEVTTPKQTNKPAAKPEKPKPQRESARGRETTKTDEARAILRPMLEANKPISPHALEKLHGISHVTFDMALCAELARRDALQEDPAEAAKFAMSVQQRFEATVRAHKRNLDIEFSIRVQAESMRRLNEMTLPYYAKKLEELEQSIKGRKGFMTRIAYRKILACLHPDRVADPAMKHRYEEAFRLFTELEKLVLNEKESPTEFRAMPRTYDDLMKMKAKVQAERRAKRTAKGMAHR